MKPLNEYIDHTLLKPEVTREQIIQLCQEAKEHKFAAVCVNPVWVGLCGEQLAGTKVQVATVVGFPLGANTSEVKAYETKQAVEQGATEIDMVLNVGALKSQDLEWVKNDVAAVVDAAKGKAIVKVILETGLLTEEEIAQASRLSVEAGAHFVKTSTGFGPGGATVPHIKLMRSIVGPEIGVKASGGVRDYETAKAMIEAGATRIGASAGIAIVTGEKGSTEGY
ncbi:deoxyribose-phosphate aldolase [Ammoniphilus sp. CFH 90114]|uniref:deoxyribose-phosphate aldolase n=1 Tax=Ammoniphilus sp. CFH 90114 TaxID=2493665 RepID=UPI00100ED04A|nr:deoxyribose-phosphate aldolase [Ammoniphilus sp. CFH 90114]RXT14818.1 deoxyribose-phosphate aldolase [Ammoniphilus sp. CFH 90114]